MIRWLKSRLHAYLGHAVCADCGLVARSEAVAWLCVGERWICLECRALHVILGEVRHAHVGKRRNADRGSENEL